MMRERTVVMARIPRSMLRVSAPAPRAQGSAPVAPAEEMCRKEWEREEQNVRSRSLATVRENKAIRRGERVGGACLGGQVERERK